jgi:hypothetical protein
MPSMLLGHLHPLQQATLRRPSHTLPLARGQNHDCKPVDLTTSQVCLDVEG